MLLCSEEKNIEIKKVVHKYVWVESLLAYPTVFAHAFMNVSWLTEKSKRRFPVMGYLCMCLDLRSIVLTWMEIKGTHATYMKHYWNEADTMMALDYVGKVTYGFTIYTPRGRSVCACACARVCVGVLVCRCLCRCVYHVVKSLLPNWC